MVIINDLNDQIVDFPGVLSTLLGAAEHSRALVPTRVGDGLDGLTVVVLEQGLVLRGLRQAAADAEERQKSFYAELFEMTAALLKTNREGGAQQTSGREQKLPVADTAVINAV